MTLHHAGEYLQRDPSMVSRFETAETPIRRGDVLALPNLYGVSEERTRDGLLQLCDDMWRKGWWEDYTSTVGRRPIDMVWLEARVLPLRHGAHAGLDGAAQPPPARLGDRLHPRRVGSVHRWRPLSAAAASSTSPTD